MTVTQLKENPHRARLLSEQTGQAVHIWKYWQEEILVCLAPHLYEALLHENDVLKVKLLQNETKKANGGKTDGY